MSRRAVTRLVLVLALVLVLVAGWFVVGVDGAWRAAYPHLPRRVQGVPYRLRAAISGPTEVPIAVPTAGAGAAAARYTAAAPNPPTSSAEASDAGTATPYPPTSSAEASDAVATPYSPTLSAEASDAAVSAPIAAYDRPSPTDSPAYRDAVPPIDLPPEASLGGFRHEYQSWNNCGPATVSMALGYWGVAGDQASAARRLKPDPDDKNVSPEELARYAREQGLRAVVRVNGSVDRLKQLLSIGVPVIAETWFVPEPGDEMGHYRVLFGYRDVDGVLLAHDSYNGASIELPYDAFDQLWRAFNRVYVPVYPPDREEEVLRVIGSDIDDALMHQRGAARAQAELIHAEDAFGWFNLGDSLLGLGDAQGAAGAFDRARVLGLPWRLLWYRFEPFEAYAAVQRWDDVLAIADANLRNAANLEESHYWRGRALDATGREADAVTAWRRAIELNPLYGEPAAALNDMP